MPCGECSQKHYAVSVGQSFVDRKFFGNEARQNQKSITWILESQWNQMRARTTHLFKLGKIRNTLDVNSQVSLSIFIKMILIWFAKTWSCAMITLNCFTLAKETKSSLSRFNDWSNFVITCVPFKFQMWQVFDHGANHAHTQSQPLPSCCLFFDVRAGRPFRPSGVLSRLSGHHLSSRSH